MVIVDRFDHSIDDKNRLAIPAAVRAAMDAEKDGTGFYAVPDAGFLQLIPEKLFEALALRAGAGLTVPMEIQEARRLYFASAARLKMDSAGRVVIPDRFLADAKSPGLAGEAVLTRDVTLVGAGDRLELWSRPVLSAHLADLNRKRAAILQGAQSLFAAPMPGPSGGPV